MPTAAISGVFWLKYRDDNIGFIALNCALCDVVLCKQMANCILNLGRVGSDMHKCIHLLAIDAPNLAVIHTLHIFHFGDMMFDILNVHFWRYALCEGVHNGDEVHQCAIPYR